MAITAKDVNELCKMTGVGMMDCKKALMETDGDIDRRLNCCVKRVWQARRRRLTELQLRVW